MNGSLPGKICGGIPTKVVSLVLILALMFGVLHSGALAQTARKVPAQTNPQRPRAPRLIVVLVIDQFRADFLDRFREKFAAGGFSRLLREGAVFRSCYYPYAITETGPGHATLATGTTPDRHGIASNEWYDPDPRRKRMVYALEDESSPVIGAEGLKPVSPRNLIGSTFSDELRLATLGRSRVFGVALKDRAAILSTGHGASGAYWYDLKSGSGFVTSKYYRETLPEWVLAFNKAHPLGQTPAEFSRSGAANNLTIAFARELIEKEDLGPSGGTDFLFIGFSANDYAGHRYGPYSQAIEKITLETDRSIAELLAYLDWHFGKGGYWLALSGDHGVAPTLVQSRDPQMARLEAKNVDTKALEAAVEAAVAERWGPGPWLAKDAGLFFDRETLKKNSVRLEDAVRVAGEAVSTISGILGYVSPWRANVPEETAQAYRLSLFPGRGPDFYPVLEPFALPTLPDEVKGGTTHGTPYTYDTQVPLILFGPAFVAGDYYDRVMPTDLATTLAAALAIHPPSLANGRVLRWAMRRAPSPTIGSERAHPR